MKLTFSCTPRHWELGLGYNAGTRWYYNGNTGLRTKMPAELYVMLGPITVGIVFGYTMEVIP